MSRYIVAVELRRIQDYVFATRRLLDAVGRSAAIADLTVPTAAELAGTCGELLFSGGGSFAAAFPTREQAHQFAGGYTRRVRDTADQLTAAVAVFDAPDTADGDLSLIHEQLIAARATAEVEHLPLTHVGLASRCSVTTGPAEFITDDRAARGREILAASVLRDRDRARGQHQSWGRILLDGIALPAGAPGQVAWAVPLELDDLSLSIGADGQHSDEASLLAVLHLDVDSLGATLRAYAATADSDLPGVSRDLTDLMTGLVRHLCQSIADAVTWEDTFPVPNHGLGTGIVTGYPETLTVPLARGHVQGQPVLFLPLRPLIVGGDDVTIVCDSRVAWSLMRAAHQWLATDTAGLADADPRRRLAARGPVFTAGMEALALTVSMGCAFFRRRSPLVTAYERAAALTEIAKSNRNATTLTWDLTGRSPNELARDHAARGGGAWLPMEAADFVVCTDAWLGPRGRLRGPGVSRGHIRRLRDASASELTLEISRRPFTLPQDKNAPKVETSDELARMLEVFEPLTRLDLVLLPDTDEREQA